MPHAVEAFSVLGDVSAIEGRDISREDVTDAEILAVRSTTKVTRELLQGSAVRFVGTATIGTDHLDLEYFKQEGIEWCYAPGCNADSVADYVTSALLSLSEQAHGRLAGSTLGVIGVGHVGCRVVRHARALGMQVVASDPPVERMLASGAATGIAALELGPVTWLPRDDVLAHADYLTLHVPLSDAGADATRQLAGGRMFSRMRPGACFLNTSRGEVMDSQALSQALSTGRLGGAVIDTWQNEPGIDATLLQQVDLGTPHIAGYSWDGRVRGTQIVYEAVCRFLDEPIAWGPRALDASGGQLSIPADLDEEDAIRSVVRAVYDVRSDDAALRRGVTGSAEEWSAYFDNLRRNYPRRREFSSASVKPPSDSKLSTALKKLGFQVSSRRHASSFP